MPIRHHLGFANLASALALVIAVGGSGVAVAAAVPKNSVGSAQIINGAVKAADLAANSVNSAKVAPDSLTGADVDESTLTLPAPAEAGAIFSNDADDFQVPTDPNIPLSSLTFEAPHSGVLQVTASASLDGAVAGGNVYVELTVDGQVVRQGYWMVPPAGSPLTQTLTGTVAVTEGEHDVVLQVTSSPGFGSTDLYLPQISAVLAPEGAAGTVLID